MHNVKWAYYYTEQKTWICKKELCLKTEDACAVYIVNSSVFRSVIILVLDAGQ